MSAIGMLARLVWYDTDAVNKYETDRRYEFIADLDAVLALYLALEKGLRARHVEVYSLDGRRLDPSRGRAGLTGYNV